MEMNLSSLFEEILRPHQCLSLVADEVLQIPAGVQEVHLGSINSRSGVNKMKIAWLFHQLIMFFGIPH